ncbi:MAG: BlaI/MecI/CopY family transcriptional regulator [Pirellulales bacterium]
MRKRTLTACEAEVMNVIWSHQSVTVQDVVDAIPRELAYTTVMTTMKILEEKEFISRGQKRGRAFTYSALVSCEAASQNTADEMANRYFDGSLKSLVLSLIKTNSISSAELAELRDAIDSIEATR